MPSGCKPTPWSWLSMTTFLRMWSLPDHVMQQGGTRNLRPNSPKAEKMRNGIGIKSKTSSGQATAAFNESPDRALDSLRLKSRDDRAVQYAVSRPVAAQRCSAVQRLIPGRQGVLKLCCLAKGEAEEAREAMRSHIETPRRRISGAITRALRFIVARRLQAVRTSVER